MASPSGSEQLSHLLQSLETLVPVHLTTAKEIRRFTGGTLPEQVRSIWQDYVVRLRRLDALIASTLPECSSSSPPPASTRAPLSSAQAAAHDKDNSELERQLLRVILFETVKVAVQDPGQDLAGLRALAVRFKGPLDGLWGCKVQRSGRSTCILLAKGRALMRRLEEGSAAGTRGVRETMASTPDMAPLLNRGAYSVDSRRSLSVIMWDDGAKVVAEVAGLDTVGTIGRLFGSIGQHVLQSASLGPQLQADQAAEAVVSPFVLVVKPAFQASEMCLYDCQGEVWCLVISKDEPPDEGYRTDKAVTHEPIDALLLRKQATRVVIVPRRSLEAANLSCLSLMGGRARVDAPAASPAALPPPPAAQQQPVHAHTAGRQPPRQSAQGPAQSASPGQPPTPPEPCPPYPPRGYLVSQPGSSRSHVYQALPYPAPYSQQLPPAAYTVQAPVSLEPGSRLATVKPRASSSSATQQAGLSAGSRAGGASGSAVGLRSATVGSGTSIGGRGGRLARPPLLGSSSAIQQQQPPCLFLLLSPAQPLVWYLLETLWGFRPWLEEARGRPPDADAGERPPEGGGGGGGAARRIASFLEQEPLTSKALVLTGSAVAGTGAVTVGDSSLTYEGFRSLWVSSASFRSGSARCLVLLDADFSGVWVDRLLREGQDLRLAVQAACGAQQSRATTPPTFLGLLTDFDRSTSELEVRAWRAQLSSLAHRGHVPCAFVQGAPPAQKSYSFLAPHVRLIGAALAEQDPPPSVTAAAAAAAAACQKARPAGGGGGAGASAVQLDPGASAFLEFALSAHQLGEGGAGSSPRLGPEEAGTKGSEPTHSSASSTSNSQHPPASDRKRKAASPSSSPPSSGSAKAPRTGCSPSISLSSSEAPATSRSKKKEAGGEGGRGKGRKKKGVAGRPGGLEGGDCAAMEEGDEQLLHGEGAEGLDDDEGAGTPTRKGPEEDGDDSSTACSEAHGGCRPQEGGESDEDDEKEEEEGRPTLEDGEQQPVGGAARVAVLERLWHGHKHELLAYMLKTCPPSTFAVPSLDALVEEVRCASQRLGHRRFDADKFRSKLEAQQARPSCRPMDVLSGEAQAASLHMLKNMCSKPWVCWFLVRSGRQDLATREEFQRIQEFLKRHKFYDKWEKALRKGQKPQLKQRLHEACPHLVIKDQLYAHLQHMRSLPEQERALMQKQVLDEMGRFGHTEVSAVLQAVESGVLLYLQGQAWPNLGLMPYWTELNGAWQLAERLSGVKFSRPGESLDRHADTAAKLEQQQEEAGTTYPHHSHDQPQLAGGSTPPQLPP